VPFDADLEVFCADRAQEGQATGMARLFGDGTMASVIEQACSDTKEEWKFVETKWDNWTTMRWRRRRSNKHWKRIGYRNSYRGWKDGFEDRKG